MNARRPLRRLAGARAMIRARRRFRAGRRNDAKRWRRRAIGVGLAVIAVAVTGWFVVNSSMFALRYVTVEGTSRLTPTDVLTAAAVHEGTPLVRLDPGTIARRVEALRPVAHAQVSRRWPHGLVITVTERRPAGVVVGDGRVELLDATGVAFGTASTAPKGLVTVDVSAPVPGAGEPAARTAMQVFGELPARVRAQATTVVARSVNAISVRLRDGRTVVWGSAGDAGTKAAVLRTLMRRSAQVYDVSTPTVAVTRG